MERRPNNKQLLVGGGRRGAMSGVELSEAVKARDGLARLAMALPMLIRLSAMTPRPTQRCMPASPL